METTILLVEDEVIIAMNEAQELVNEGYRVLTAYSGSEAVEVARKEAGNIDLILMDIDLGKGMDGTEAASEILKQQDIPILFLSSHTEKDIVDKTEKITSYGYVVKNTGITVLAASIKMAFKLHEAHNSINAINMEIEAANKELQHVVKELEQTNRELIRSEKDLMEREAQYRLLADNMTDTVWLMDMDLKTLYISPSVERVRGFTLDEINNMPPEAHLTPGSLKHAIDLFHEALSPENLDSSQPRINYTVELEFYRKDGSTFWSENAFALIRDGVGKPVNILGSGRDITERKRAEEKIMRERENFFKILSAAPVGLMLLNSDTTVVQSNDAMGSLVFRDPAEIIGKRAGGGVGCIHSSDDPRGCGFSGSCPMCPLRQKLESTITDGTSTHGAEINLVLLINGNPRECWLNISTEPVIIDDLQYVIVAVDDITARKQAEEALLQSKNLLQTIIDAAPVAIIALDLDGKVHTVWNHAAEKMLGWKAEEAIGQFLPSVPTDKEEEFARFRETIRSGKSLDGIEVRRLKRDGTPIEYSIYGSPLHDARGTITGNIAVLVDITERRRTEDKLRRSEWNESLMNQIQTIFLTADDDAMYGRVQSVLRDALKSRFGLFGFIADNGDLVIPGLTADVWSECLVSNKSAVFPAASWGESLWGKAIRELKSFRSDGPFHTPEGHVHIDNFLTTPVVYGGKTIGLISVANSETGYTDDDRELLEVIAGSISPILNARLQRDRLEREHWQDEEALRNSEYKYRIVADNTYDWEFWIGPDGRFLYNSSSCERVTGHTAAEFEDDPGLMLRIVHPEDQEPFSVHQSEAAEKQEPANILFRIVHHDSGFRWIEHLCQPIYDDNGRFIGTRGSNRDVTERIRAEKINQARLRLLEFAESHSTDETLTAALDEIEALTESIIGFYHFLEPDQRTLSLQNWSTNTLRNMCTAEGKGSHYDIAKAGVWVDCVYERRPVIHNDYSSLPHRKGTPEGHTPVVREAVVPIIRGNTIKAIIGVGNKSTLYNENDIDVISHLGDLSWDIVERKLAEETLRVSEARYHSIYENSFDAIMLTTPDGRILAANPEACRMFGRSEEEICMLGRSRLVDTTDPRLVPALDERARTGRYRTELTLIRSDGTKFPGEVTSTVFRDTDGNVKTSMIIRKIVTGKPDGGTQ